MCDAPQHGVLYNNNFPDNFPHGDPEGRTGVSVLGDFQHESITLSFGRVTPYTDAMLELLQEDASSVGSEILVYDLGAGHAFAQG